VRSRSESRSTLSVWGAALTLFAGLGSFLVYELTKTQCSGGPTDSVAEALEERNSVCRALGLPLAPGGGGHGLLVGLLAVPPAIASLGALVALSRRSSGPLVVAFALTTVTGLGLVVLGGNASVRLVGGP